MTIAPRTRTLGALALAVTAAFSVLAAPSALAADDPTGKQLLEACNNDSNATCKFHPSGPLDYSVGQMAKVSHQENCTSSPSTLVYEHSGTVGTKNIYGFNFSFGTNVSNGLTAAIATSYQKEWYKESKVTSQLRQDVGPKTAVDIYAGPQITRVHGRWELLFKEPKWGHYYWYLDDTIEGRTSGQQWSFYTQNVRTTKC
jgi:hypothetical protein